MGRFRVTLDGTLLQDEPIGLLEAELSIERDEDLKGIFFQYATDITFWGDGYDILKDIDNNNQDCSQVDCLIEYQCSNDEPFQTLFEGVVPVGSEDIDWDDTNCMVTASIEAADFSDLIRRYGDFPIKINGATCVDGTTALTAIDTYTTDFFPGFFGNYTTTNRKAYKFTDVVEQVFAFITNNNVTVDFDSLYTTPFQNQIINVEFTGGPLDGQPLNYHQIETTFDNYYGQHYSISHQVDFVDGAGTTDLMYYWLAKLMHIIDENVSPAYGARTNNMEKINRGTSVLPTTLAQLENHLPITNLSITVNSLGPTPPPAVTAVITETQSHQWGLDRLAIVNTTRLQGQDSDMYVTINQLMEHMAQFHNMGYRFIKSGSGYQLQIRKLEDLINDTSSSVQLQNVNGIQHKRSGKYSFASFTGPSGAADSIFRDIPYTTSYCFGENGDADGENYSSQEFFDVINNAQSQDDKLMFFFLDPASTTANALARRYYFKLGFHRPGAGIATFDLSDDYAHYSAPYFHPFITERYFINMAPKSPNVQIPKSQFDNISVCTGCPAGTLVNTETKSLRTLYSFEHPLTFSQVQDLISNSLDYINFGDGKTNKNGFIKEISIPFKDFVAKFDVYSD